MSTLDRRLTALEQLAEQCRRREMRELVLSLPEARGLTPAELEAATDEALRLLEEVQALKRQGFTDQQIIRMDAERIAAKSGGIANDVLQEAGLDPADYR